jgi:hypothetical protein
LIYPQQRAGGFFFFLAYPALPLLITYFFIFYYLPTFRHFISPFHTNNTHPTPPLPTDPPTLITHHLVSYYSPYTPTISNLSTQSLITNNPPKTILLPSHPRTQHNLHTLISRRTLQNDIRILSTLLEQQSFYWRLRCRRRPRNHPSKSQRERVNQRRGKNLTHDSLPYVRPRTSTRPGAIGPRSGSYPITLQWMAPNVRGRPLSPASL